jgi:hypothetical protein
LAVVVDTYQQSRLRLFESRDAPAMQALIETTELEAFDRPIDVYVDEPYHTLLLLYAKHSGCITLRTPRTHRTFLSPAENFTNLLLLVIKSDCSDSALLECVLALQHMPCQREVADSLLRARQHNQEGLRVSDMNAAWLSGVKDSIGQLVNSDGKLAPGLGPAQERLVCQAMGLSDSDQEARDFSFLSQKRHPMYRIGKTIGKLSGQLDERIAATARYRRNVSRLDRALHDAYTSQALPLVQLGMPVYLIAAILDSIAPATALVLDAKQRVRLIGAVRRSVDDVRAAREQRGDGSTSVKKPRQ